MVLMIAAMVPAVEKCRTKAISNLLTQYERAHTRRLISFYVSADGVGGGMSDSDYDCLCERIDRQIAQYKIREAVPVMQRIFDSGHTQHGIWGIDRQAPYQPCSWRPSMAQALGAIGTPAAIDLLIQYIHMPGAPTALAKTGSLRGLLALEFAETDWMARTFRDPEVEAEIQVSLASRTTNDPEQLLLQVIENPKQSVLTRRWAIQAIEHPICQPRGMVMIAGAAVEMPVLTEIMRHRASVAFCSAGQWSFSGHSIETARLVALLLANLHDPSICWFCVRELKDRAEPSVSQLIAGFALDLGFSVSDVETGTGPVAELLRERAKILGVSVAKLFEGAKSIGFAPPPLWMLRSPLSTDEIFLAFPHVPRQQPNLHRNGIRYTPSMKFGEPIKF
jgi:hypothetical protein